jgi:hypothetical protein
MDQIEREYLEARDGTNSKEDTKHVEGRRWDTSGNFATYEGAKLLKERYELTESERLDIKIHKVKERFVVKTRTKIEEESKTQKQKRRKNKKNKKG